MAKLMLIDGNSLTYRAFFALPTDMATASGQVTNAVFGFTSMLINLLRDHEPQHMAVAFDRPEPTFRHEMVSTYKEGRAAAPDILRQQMGLVRQVIDALAIPVLEKVGVEADDIIATLATQARDRGDDVIVVTGDRDSYQLVEDPHIKVLYNKRGVSDYAFYDEAGIEERTGVHPSDYVIYAALRGDKSDNLPGVPGVGEKTAAKLVNTYRTLDGIFEAAPDQTPKLRQNLEENEEQARSNQEMMVLLRDVELDLPETGLVMGDVDADEVRRLFEFLEFRALLGRLEEVLGHDLSGGGGGANEVLEAEVTRLETAEEAATAIDAVAAGSGVVAIAAGWVGADPSDSLEGLAMVSKPDAAEVLWIPEHLLVDDKVASSLKAVLTSRPIAAHDSKSVLRSIATYELGVDDLHMDTRLGGYLLDPAETRYIVNDLLVRYCAMELPEETGAAEGQLDLDGDAVDAAVRVGREALAIDRLVEPMRAALDAQGLSKLFDEMELPLVRVLARMEFIGVGVDRSELESLRDHLVSECDRLRAEIHKDAGREFNVNSTKVLREVLFEDLELTPQKKTKTGFSTDAASLEKLLGDHPIIEHLLAYREVEKLRSTYGEGLLASVGPDDRIHATFNQTVARTGRLSSEDPNLHNIPVRSEMGRSFRKAFVPADGYTLLVADYNQIELRCIAHLAEDPGLIGAFEAGDDIHEATAARIFGVEPSDVTIEQRSKSKMVSYGLAYGMEAYGLGQRLNIPTDEAAEILDAYFKAFPSVKQYMDDTVAEARERGYTETLFGRRRQIPELSSGNFRIRQAGERQAMNAGIQGLAADIFKVALVRLDDEIAQRNLESRVILQVHDEVVLEVPESEQETLADLTTEVMGAAFDLRVPLAVNLSFGASWADAK